MSLSWVLSTLVMQLRCLESGPPGQGTAVVDVVITRIGTKFYVNRGDVNI
jgi:hypothetical protein